MIAHSAVDVRTGKTAIEMVYYYIIGSLNINLTNITEYDISAP